MKIGIDLGGSHIGIGVIDKNFKIVDKKEKDITEQDKLNIEKTLIDNIVYIINQLLKENNINKDNIECIGIASPGIISDQSIINANNLKIYEFNIVKQINRYFDVRIMINNDAKCAAMAEKKCGILKKYSDCIFLSLGTGIGGACFLKDELLKPKKYQAFELGHMIIQIDGKTCSCGNKGCFEAYASIKSLKQQVKEKLKIDNEITGKLLLEAINNNIKELDCILDKYSKYLAIGLINLINIFEPEAIALGGSFVYYKDILLDKVKNNINYFNQLNKPEILIANFKNDAGIIGSILM